MWPPPGTIKLQDFKRMTDEEFRLLEKRACLWNIIGALAALIALVLVVQ